MSAGADASRRDDAVSAATAVAAGLTLWAAHPPVAAWPLVFLPVPLLLVALRRARTPLRQFLLGGLAGAVGYGLAAAWVVEPAGYVGWILLTGVEGLFVAVYAVVVGRFVSGPAVVVAAPLAWTGMEAFRATTPFGGFGWAELAYAHVDGSWMLPLARLLGGRALTLMTALTGALLFEVYRRSTDATAGLQGTRLERVQASLPHANRPLLGLAAVLLVSVVATIEPPAADGGTLDVLAVQGNDPDLSVPDPRAEDLRIARRHLELTRGSIKRSGRPDLTIWPESSVDRDITTPAGQALAPVVSEAAELTAGNLLVGTNVDGPDPRTFENSAVLVDRAGAIVDRYVKRRLVPFGEYVPFRSVIGGLGPLRQVPRDAVPGPGAHAVDVGRTSVAVGICFETLFPDALRSNVRAPREPAGLLVAITNDVSFGRSSEPEQHLAQSRLRAVETGRWVVHASLAGRSALVDPQGRVHELTPLFEEAVIRAEVPVVTGLTPYLSFGDVVGVLGQTAYVILAMIALVLAFRSRRREP